MTNSDITEEQAEALLRNFAESKRTLHAFFIDVIKSKDTTKTGNLTEIELGLPTLPVRSYKELSLFCEDIYANKGWNDFFSKMSEIQTSTSLSKDALLLKLSVTQKKELADVSPKPKKENKGWFKKKDATKNEQN